MRGTILVKGPLNRLVISSGPGEVWLLCRFYSEPLLLFKTLKGNSTQKTSYAQMKEREKCKKMSPHWPQYAKWFSRYLIPKSGIWARWKSPFWRFSGSFSHKYDVTDDNEKWKCNISGFVCSICLKFSWLLKLSKRISLDFKFSCFGIYNKNNKPLFKNKRLLFSHNKKSVSSFFFQKMIIRAVIIQLYCFRLFFENALA